MARAPTSAVGRPALTALQLPLGLNLSSPRAQDVYSTYLSRASSPRCGRDAHDALERPAEGFLRLVADPLGDCRYLGVARRQASRRELHSPLGEILHRRLP